MTVSGDAQTDGLSSYHLLRLAKSRAAGVILQMNGIPKRVVHEIPYPERKYDARDEIVLERVVDEFTAPLCAGQPNRILDNLVRKGHELRHVTSTHVVRSRVGVISPVSRFETVWQDYALVFDAGIFRFQPLDASSAFLVLFHVAPEQQGQGIGGRMFRKLSDDLADAGAETQFGKVCPVLHLQSRTKMDGKQLMAFYLRHGPFEDVGSGWIVRRGPNNDRAGCDVRRRCHGRV